MDLLHKLYLDRKELGILPTVTFILSFSILLF